MIACNTAVVGEFANRASKLLAFVVFGCQSHGQRGRASEKIVCPRFAQVNSYYYIYLT